MLGKIKASATHPSRLTIIATVLMFMGALGLLSAGWSAVSEIPRQLGAAHVSGRVTGNGSRNVLRYAQGRPNGLIVYYITFSYEAEGGSYDGNGTFPTTSG